MGRNERCWCGSGKKWKLCHLGREQQEPVNVYEHMRAMRDQFGKGRCSHPEAGPDTCGGRVIRSHTIQKHGGLAAIAEDGHVISVRSAFERLRYNEGQIIPAKMGVNRASTFLGFCDRHDSEMFKSVENGTIVPCLSG
jgi:SEC-C motif